MTRGFDAVGKALAAQGADTPPGRLLVLAGKTLVSTVGGASGPLWGSALRAAGRSLGDAEDFDGPQLATALDAALAAVVDLGAAAARRQDDGRRARRRRRRRCASGWTRERSIAEAVTAAADAAEAGAQATAPMQARKGRASYLGERSIGHQDPGATSAALIMRALQTAVTQERSGPLPHRDARCAASPRRRGSGSAPCGGSPLPSSAGAVVAGGAARRRDRACARRRSPPPRDELDALAARLRADGRDSDAEIVETGALMALDPGLAADVRAAVARRRPAGGGRDPRGVLGAGRRAGRARRTRCSPRGPTTCAAWGAGRRCWPRARSRPSPTDAISCSSPRTWGRPTSPSWTPACRPWRSPAAARPRTPRSSRGRSGSRWSRSSVTPCSPLADGAVIVVDGGDGVVLAEPDAERIQHARGGGGAPHARPRARRRAARGSGDDARRAADHGARQRRRRGRAAPRARRRGRRRRAPAHRARVPAGRRLADPGATPPRARARAPRPGRPARDRPRPGLRRRQAPAVPRRRARARDRAPAAGSGGPRRAAARDPRVRGRSRAARAPAAGRLDRRARGRRRGACAPPPTPSARPSPRWAR